LVDELIDKALRMADRQSIKAGGTG
jgi:hypothetical protein